MFRIVPAVLCTAMCRRAVFDRSMGEGGAVLRRGAMKARPWFDVRELRQLLRLAVPLLVANLAQVGMGVVDTIVAGKAGTVEMAGAALGCSLVIPVLFAGSGLLSILGPMVSRLRGEGREGRVGLLIRDGLYFSLGLAAAALVVLSAARGAFGLLSDDRDMVRIASDYVTAVMWGVPAFMVYCVFKSLFEGFELTNAVMAVSLGGLLCNIPADLAFVFGWWGLPRLGGAGCGAATALIYWVQLGLILVLLASSRRMKRHCVRLSSVRPPSWSGILSIFKLGFPLGVSVLCEVTFFSAASFVLACFGPVVVGAQQVSINVSSVCFSLPLSLGVAASLRMAWYVGRRDGEGVDALARTGLCTTVAFSFLLMAVIILFRTRFIACYTEDPALAAIAEGLLVLCAVYQCPDGIQSFLGGALRGMHDTAVISRVNIFTYWCVGFPLCLMLVRTNWVTESPGAAGAWVSFIAALLLTAVLLSLRYAKTRRKLFAEWAGGKKRASS